MSDDNEKFDWGMDVLIILNNNAIIYANPHTW